MSRMENILNILCDEFQDPVDPCKVNPSLTETEMLGMVRNYAGYYGKNSDRLISPSELRSYEIKFSPYLGHVKAGVNTSLELRYKKFSDGSFHRGHSEIAYQSYVAQVILERDPSDIGADLLNKVTNLPIGARLWRAGLIPYVIGWRWCLLHPIYEKEAEIVWMEYRKDNRVSVRRSKGRKAALNFRHHLKPEYNVEKQQVGK